MTEMVPESWTIKRLSEFSKARRGTTYVASELSEDRERYPLYINMKSFKVGGGYNEKGDKYFSSPYSPNQIVRENDLLIANTDVTDACDILGAAVYLPREKLRDDVLFSHHVSALNVADDVDVNFLSFLFGSENLRLEMKRCGRGTTVKMLDMKDIGRISFAIPPLPEQKKIASILTSVDEVIENTQKQIAKLQDLKKATMNELLTKGIGHTEFKDSELGRIPETWEEMTLGAAVQKNIITDIQDGNHGAQHPKASDYVKDGIPFVMASNLKGGVIDVGNANKIPREIYENLRIGFAKTGDVLLTHKATIGLVAIVNEDTPEVMCTPQVTYYRIGSKDKLRSRFLFYWFQSDQFQNEMVRLSGQSTRDYIGITAQKTLLVRMPPMEEQVEIIRILESIDHNLLMNKHSLHQTQSLKKSLMQDLLTGKVRVQVN